MILLLFNHIRSEPHQLTKTLYGKVILPQEVELSIIKRNKLQQLIKEL